VGSIREIYNEYGHLESVLPAMGYGDEQVKELEQTINSADCDVVLSATPIDLSRIVNINKPIVRVVYRYGDHGKPALEEVLLDRIKYIK
jgi:predicted GTPase